MRGISPIVAYVLLIAIIVIGAVGTYYWAGTIVTNSTGQKYVNPNTPISITPLGSNYILVSNLGVKPIPVSVLRTSESGLNVSCNGDEIPPGGQVTCELVGTPTNNVTAVYGLNTGVALVNLNESINPVREWLFTGWPYRQEIYVHGIGQENYQVKLVLNSSVVGEHFNWSNDGLRFSCDFGGLEMQIPYWIQTWNSTDKKAIIWIKLPVVNDNTRVFMYYGNPSAVNTSNGDAVFEFFDDFNENVLDPNKWSIVNMSNGAADASYSVSNGILDIKGPTKYVSGGLGLGVFSKRSFGTNTVIMTYVTKENNYNGRTDDVGYSNAIPTYWPNINKNFYAGWYGGSGSGSNGGRSCHIENWANGSGQGSTVSCFTPPIVLEVVHLVSKTILYLGGNNYSLSQNTPQGLGNVSIWVSGGWADQGYYSEISLDWIAVRKYSSPEPTVTFGKEEIGG